MSQWGVEDLLDFSFDPEEDTRDQAASLCGYILSRHLPDYVREFLRNDVDPKQEDVGELLGMIKEL